MSAKFFLPKVYETIQSDVTIISARTRYQHLYPGDYQKWKVEAFLEARTEMEYSAITNLIVIGDSNFEMQAAKILGGHFKKAFIKTVKFRHSPSTAELIKQVYIVNQKFDKIFLAAKSLSVLLLKTHERDERDQLLAQKNNTES